MTYTLETMSHGKIESGFLATFTQFFRIGEYTFSTELFCETIRRIAQDPNSRKETILYYPLEEFERKNQQYLKNLVRTMKLATKYAQEAALEKEIKDSREGINLEELTQLHLNGNRISISINSKKGSIQIGIYQISALEFRYFAFYLAEGGFMGWDETPTFAKATLNALKNPKHRLFRDINKQLKKSKKNE